MSRSYWEINSFQQPTERVLRRNVENTRQKAVKKGKELHPIVVEGRSITNSWWGNAWCKNLERYADYKSRIDRGKRYVHSGAVVDLQIEKGRVSAKVQGSRKTPYKVDIRISPMSEEACQSIIGRCTTKVGNIEQLVSGSFPEEMKELFGGRNGLFPSAKEISFNCSCPDWALMCKHVAAALYGIGVRLDEDPLLFFELRGIDINRFIDVTLANKVDKMLENAETALQHSSRVIYGAEELSDLFGVL